MRNHGRWQLVTAARALALLALVMAVAETTEASSARAFRTKPEVETITLKHHGGAFGVAAVRRLEPFQPLDIVITDTDTACFSFNVIETFDPLDKPTAIGSYKAQWTDEVYVPLLYDPAVSGYEIEAIKKKNADTSCNAAAEGKWIVHIKRRAWAVGFAGAFLGDRITDPVFFLKEGADPEADVPGDGGGDPTTGFFVRRRDGAEDSIRLGTAGMIHLFRENSTRKVEWAPLSFGLGVTGGSDLRYYLGTSAKFGDKAFLTAGWTFGSRERLPDALEVGDFTTNAQALGNLPTRMDDGFFVAISYTFLSTGVDSLMRTRSGLEKPKVTTSATTPAAATPAASGNARGSAAPSGDGGSTSALRIRETALSATPGAAVTIVVGADAAPADDIEYTLTVTQGADQLASALPASYTFPKGGTSHDVSIQLKADASGIVELEFRPAGHEEALQTVTITVVSSDG